MITVQIYYLFSMIVRVSSKSIRRNLLLWICFIKVVMTVLLLSLAFKETRIFHQICVELHTLLTFNTQLRVSPSSEPTAAADRRLHWLLATGHSRTDNHTHNTHMSASASWSGGGTHGGLARPPSFARTQPHAQLQAKLAPFNNGVDPRRTRRPQSATQPAPAPSDDDGDNNNNASGRVEYFAPPSRGVSGQMKREVPGATNRTTQIGTLLAAANDDNDVDAAATYAAIERQQVAMDAALRTRQATSIIGGQAPGADMYKTANQLHFDGRPVSAAATSAPNAAKRINLSQQAATVNQVSPITFQPTAEYGTWRGDASAKLAYDRAAAIPANKTGLFAVSGIPLVDKVRAALAPRGAAALLALSRHFRRNDDDGSETVTLPDFKRALRGVGLMLTETEIAQLFKQFDRGSGDVSYTRFMAVLRVSGVLPFVSSIALDSLTTDH